MNLHTLSFPSRRRTTAGSRAGAARSHRRSRPWLVGLAIVPLLLLAIRFVGSPIATSIVNRKLGALEGFVGRVESVDLSVWRGTVNVRNFVLRARGRDQDPPLAFVRQASLTIAPAALFSGKLGGRVLIGGAEFNAVKHRRFNGPADAAEEAKQEVAEKTDDVARWQDGLREAFPMELTRVEVRNAAFRFVDETHDPKVDVGIRDLRVLATDLQNRPKGNGDPLPAKLELTGVTTGDGRLSLSVQLDPLAEQPRLKGRMEIRDLQLPPFNSFLLAYANADVSRGTFEMYMEVEAEGGAYNGYIKPLLHDLDFRTASDKDKNAAELLAKKVVTAVASVFENDEKNQVATKAPFSGNFEDNQVDIWSTIGTLFRNAFVEALRGGFEGQTPNR
ncbi:MAG TPA: DUF748 domain-containing protein [Opitutus sp.]|nr:DUF748 domain-containing protein [Opitutus sp.]